MAALGHSSLLLLGRSSVALNRSNSVVVCGLNTVVAPVCCGAQAPGAWAVVVVYRPCSSEACGVFLDQESDLKPLRWQADSIGPPGKSDSNFKTSTMCYIRCLKELIVREEVWEEFMNQVIREERRRTEVKGVRPALRLGWMQQTGRTTARGPGEAFSATGGVEIWSERQEGSTVAAKLWHDVNEIYKRWIGLGRHVLGGLCESPAFVLNTKRNKFIDAQGLPHGMTFMLFSSLELRVWSSALGNKFDLVSQYLVNKSWKKLLYIWVRVIHTFLTCFVSAWWFSPGFCLRGYWMWFFEL